MIYNAPAKGEDGLYFVKTLNDDKRKCFVQLNKVKIGDVSGEVTVVITDTKKIDTIDAGNLSAALENCESWFGKKLSENVISGAYTPSVKDGHVMSFLSLPDFGLRRRRLDRLGILSRSGFMMTPSPSSILTQTNMLSLMKMTNKKNCYTYIKHDEGSQPEHYYVGRRRCFDLPSLHHEQQIQLHYR
jgi:hypothetical protein